MTKTKKKVQLGVLLDEDIHIKLKIKCAKKKVAIKDAVAEALKDWTNRK